MKRNIYDFDNAIYNGDSGYDFIRYCMDKYPGLVYFHLFKSIWYCIRYAVRNISFKELKQYVFSFVNKIEDLDELIEDFAMIYKDRMKTFYVDRKRDDDIIISASLDFYLVPLCKRMQIKNVICTKYNVKTGKIIGENCHDEEKVKRFRKEYKNVEVQEAYSDSLSDVPMLKLAKDAYIVKGKEVERRLFK